MHSFETAERKVALCVNATQNKKNISIENRINNDLEKNEKMNHDLEKN